MGAAYASFFFFRAGQTLKIGLGNNLQPLALKKLLDLCGPKVAIAGGLKVFQHMHRADFSIMPRNAETTFSVDRPSRSCGGIPAA